MKNYRDPEKIKFPGQAPVSMIVPDYKLNGKGELVEVGKVDLQEVIDSNLSSTLDAILDKFLNPSGAESAARRLDVDFLQDDLDNLTEAKEFFDDCRERYNRPDFTDDQIFDFIRQEAEKNKNKLKGVLDNEGKKKNRSPEESPIVQEDGEPASPSQPKD